MYVFGQHRVDRTRWIIEFLFFSINQSINQSLFQAETHKTNNKEKR